MDPFFGTLGIWVGALLTLMGWSWLYKENLLSRFAEHTLVAATAAYVVSTGFSNVIKLAITPISQGMYLRIIPVILGLALYLRFWKGTYFISRWPLAIIIATGLGIQIRAKAEGEVLGQIIAAMVGFGGPDPYANFINLLIMLITIITTSYFIFTMKAEALKTSAKIGRYFAMVWLGAVYGNTLAARINILIGRLMFILYDWIGLR